MTCRYSSADWRDILYNAVRKAPGGVAAAAAFLSQRRGVGIHPEDLRKRLRGADGDTLSTEMLELLTEWLQDLNRPDALAWLQAFNARYDMVAAHVPPCPDVPIEQLVEALRTQLLNVAARSGTVAARGLHATSDGQVDDAEGQALEADCMEAITVLFQLQRRVRRAVGRGAA